MKEKKIVEMRNLLSNNMKFSFVDAIHITHYNGSNLSSKLSLQNDLVDGSKLEISKNSILFCFTSSHSPSSLYVCLFWYFHWAALSDSSLMLLRGWKRNWDVNDDVSTKSSLELKCYVVETFLFWLARSIWRLLSLNFLIKGMKFFHSLCSNVFSGIFIDFCECSLIFWWTKN